MSKDTSSNMNQLYISLFHSIKDCVAVFRVVDDGNNFLFVDMNQSALDAESITKKDIIGKLVTDVFPGVRDFGIFKIFQDVYNDGIDREFPMTQYNDERIAGWRENHIYKLDDNHIFSVYNDVTKAKQAEQDLELAAKVFDTSLEGILIADKDVKIIKANESFLKMSGFDFDEIVGKKANILRSNIHDEKFYNDMWNSIELNGSWQGEIWNRRKNGESFAVFLNITTSRDDDNNIKNYIAIYLDITEQKKSQDYIYKLAFSDILTKLANRAQFDIEINRYITKAKRDKNSFALLFLDLDNFKYVNDTFGHDIGDLLLIDVASRLENIVRDVDFIARLGGDEFVIIMDNIQNNDKVILLCERILAQFKKQFTIKNNKFKAGCSIGISIYPNDGTDKNMLVKHADTAMYTSKKEGKNRFYFHTQEMNREFSRKLELDTQLREALEKNQFEIYYQPKICVHKKTIIGAEALIRWNSPKLGFVNPAEFIPYAEESGLIIPIGDYVLETVIKKVKELEYITTDLKVSLNVSSMQLSENNFIQKVESILKVTKCNTSMLEFEITETKIMQNVEENIEKLLKIKELGISISIDDFGTGYSSMSYLQKLPINIIKIDKSFVDNIPHTHDGNVIVQGIISLSKALSLKIIAEGVEIQEQNDFLKDNGCDMIQGYLYSKPLKEVDFLEFLKKNL